MRVSIAHNVVEAFSEIRVAAVRVTGLRAALMKIDTEYLMADALKSFAVRGFDSETIAETDWVRSWRNAYAKSGYAPGKYRSSIEALARRALKSPEGLPTGIKVVDFYNAVSIANLAALGGYDAAKLPGKEVRLRYATADDNFEPLGGKLSDFPLKDTGVVYGCGNTVVCYGFNHRDSVRTCLEATTDVGLFFGEAVDAASFDRLRQAMEQLCVVLLDAGADVGDVLWLDAEHRDGLA